MTPAAATGTSALPTNAKRLMATANSVNRRTTCMDLYPSCMTLGPGAAPYAAQKMHDHESMTDELPLHTPRTPPRGGCHTICCYNTISSTSHLPVQISAYRRTR